MLFSSLIKIFSIVNSSFDMFKNFEERGKAFKEAIKNNVT